MAAWALILIGAGMGMVAGFFLVCALGLAKKADRQAEVDFWRMKQAERERDRHLMVAGTKAE